MPATQELMQTYQELIKISFSRLLPQMACLMPEAHASTKLCVKGDYK